MLPGPERDNVNHGGKVIMPPSALDKLTRLHITYPMLFELINGAKERMTHAGVLEFIAEEGKIYLPFWVCIRSACLTSRLFPAMRGYDVCKQL
jgi:ubiquitin fusion degradation protein 1